MISIAICLVAIVGWSRFGSSAHAASDTRDGSPSLATPPGSFTPVLLAARAAATAAPARPTPVVAAAPETRAVVVTPQAAPRVVRRPTNGMTAVFLGDSYTTGWRGAGVGGRAWPVLVGRAKGWRTVTLAVAGTGFINPGWTGQPLGSMVPAAARQHPDVVVIASGHNNSRWSASATGAAADRAIDGLRRALPHAIFVIVGPIWQDGAPPLRCLVLRDHLRRKAAAIGAVFIDPLAEGWFAGTNHRFIGPDGLHPTDAGHAHMARLVLDDLAGL